MKIDITIDQASKYNAILADVLCFFKGVEYAVAINPNKKIEASLAFFNIDTIRELRSIFCNAETQLYKELITIKNSDASKMPELERENALLKQRLKELTKKAV